MALAVYSSHSHSHSSSKFAAGADAVVSTWVMLRIDSLPEISPLRRILMLLPPSQLPLPLSLTWTWTLSRQDYSEISSFEPSFFSCLPVSFSFSFSFGRCYCEVHDVFNLFFFFGVDNMYDE